MSRILYAAVLLAAVAVSVSAIGCQSTGGGGYSGSDGHYGHNH